MTTTRLLEEFPPVSTEAWEEVIAKDLRGADYAKKLIWQTPEGIAVRPYYRAEDAQPLDFAAAAPGEFPFVRGARAEGGWRIREEIPAAAPEAANRAAQSAVTGGAEEIAFRSAAIANASDLAMLLANLREIPVHFLDATEETLRLLATRLEERPDAARLSADWNPLTNIDFAASLAATAPAALIPFTLDAAALEESGATAVEELAFALAAGIDLVAALEEHGLKPEQTAARVEFSFAAGSNYFFEMAKLRAFRLLWARALESFGAPRPACVARIHARTSRWNKTVYDPHVNVLRATTEAMAAILGGADSVSVAPFDECYKTPDEASRRLARNTQILLKEEALLGRVADAGGGSYALEAVTDSLARAAWARMQRIEALGGYRKALASGEIANALARSLAAREKAVVTRRRVLTGANQFANPKERALDRIDVSRTSKGKRGAEIYEQLRLRTERHAARTGKTPLVLLAEFGDAKMRGARSNFAANFFACAGFELVSGRFKNAQEMAAREADLIVLCSADAEYAAMAPAAIESLKAAGRATPVIVAGNPENAEALKAAGVADFIHIRSNPIEVLGRWQQRLGIED
ncbi:MAG: methylmalonyl-CoA mutase family protein [Terracidiphilus sp.]